MSDNPNDLDRDLQVLFRNCGRQLEAEPFVLATLKAIERRRSYRRFAGFLLQLLAIGGIVALSPTLIRGSAWLSDALAALFDFGGNVLSKPLGTAVAVVVALAVLLMNVRRNAQRL